MDSSMISASERFSFGAVQRSKATRKTATPASAVRLAAGSSTPRSRSASARAVARRAILISSRSVRAAWELTTACRARAKSRRSTNHPAASSRAAETTCIGLADAGAAATRPTSRSCSSEEPANSTSRLSAKWRKKVRSVRPARSAMRATVVSS